MNSLIFYSRFIELGWPWNLIFPNLSTKQTKGIPEMAKSLISLWLPSHPFNVTCWIFVHPLSLILFTTDYLLSSTLKATILTFLCHKASFFQSISWLCCIGFWQGPHQVAQTSTSKTSPNSCLNVDFPSVNTLSTSP